MPNAPRTIYLIRQTQLAVSALLQEAMQKYEGIGESIWPRNRKDLLARCNPVLEPVLNGPHRSYVNLAPPAHPSAGRSERV